MALYGEKICVSLDCSNGFVTQQGWVSVTNIKATDLALELEAMGLQWMVYTDIARDGALTGPNFEQIENMLKTVKKINLIASGGIATLEDVRKLASMQGVAAAITGKAIYEGKLDFKEALSVIASTAKPSSKCSINVLFHVWMSKTAGWSRGLILLPLKMPVIRWTVPKPMTKAARMNWFSWISPPVMKSVRFFWMWCKSCGMRVYAFDRGRGYQQCQ